MYDLAYLIPALPLAGFALLIVFGKRAGDPGAGWLATLAVLLAFLATLGVWVEMLGEEAHGRRVAKHLFTWVAAGELDVEAGLLVDQLSITMALFVTGVSFLIHLYSIGYMRGDERYHRFFVYLNLFVFSMLVLVLGDNLVLTFLGWEGVGACSYLLISFWFERETAATAGKKAFVTNRIGDFGFMIAMFLLFGVTGTLSYEGIFEAVEGGEFASVTVTAAALLLFLGACGKSAQLPLYVWLPDAMEGPTPVSALIHAATMVTAGVFLMTRMSPLLAQSDDALTIVAVVGAATALFAATIACAQDDIKRVLAYSTISQLGYMFLAVGSGAYVAAIFHMVTHAFFKALLFLGAGSVIHGLHEEQDMKRMGALRRFMPVTAVTFIVGWLAIAGVPPFAGFWSKDDILLAAWDKSKVLWGIGLFTALLTAYYMSRQVFLVFFGGQRWRHPEEAGVRDREELTEPEPVATEHGTGEPHESPWVMLLPLVVLAALSAVGGGLNLPFGDLEFLHEWLDPVFEGILRTGDQETNLKVTLAALAITTGVLGLGIAWLTFVRGRRTVVFEPVVLKRGWGVDDLYALAVDVPGRAVANFSADIVDVRVIDGAVNGVATAVRAGGSQLRKAQTGYVRNYALAVAFGATVLLTYALVRSGI